MSLATRADVEVTVINVANDMVAGWDIDLPNGITSETKLMEDLSFESIDVVQFAVAIEQAVERKGLPFEKLFMKEGEYVDDVELREVSDFLCKELGVH
ncbi:acyl carrier protein [Ancylobacter pratisalsi]|uniref:Acyl carrier protein n=1 Tax=Ancylobacter pratisalsi TaxID=1745854 RepID=A0A6P1YQ44_9HYPH|nr:acyl carrier protein [Ancylobacter pratisalsi]QIB35165.1 acyl carrier protein [Ancylobacter pratisalsi]